MNKILTFIAILLISVHSTMAASDKIEKLIDEVDPNINIGIKITNLSQNKDIYSLNAGRHFVFGSAVKILPIFGVLDHYDDDYAFKSYITNDAGNLYLHINDPDFSTKDLSNMLDKVKSKMKGKQIESFYVVKEKFSVPEVVREKIIADASYCYGAQISKVHVNKNCARLVAEPTEVGKKVKISRKETIPYEINNTSKTVSKKTPDRIHTSIDGNKINISGTLSQATGKVNISVVVPDSIKHLQNMTKEMLKKKEIKISGKVLVSSKANQGKVIVSKVKKIKDLAKKAMIKSDNFITDYFLAHYANSFRADEWRKATGLLKKLINSNFGVDFLDTTIHDGSGLSRGNIITVDHFSQFLGALSKKDNFADIQSTFSVPGDDGTMKTRLSGQTNIYAKTGTLTNVTALVGYYYNNENELHSFVVVINNYYGSKQKYTDLIDNIIAAVRGM